MIASQTGRPLVQHVVDQVSKCRRIADIIVATDDQRIVEALRPYGTRCMLTDPSHPSGTDRVAQVASKIHCPNVINVQGDEPEIDPSLVDTLAYHLDDEPSSAYPMWTAATPFASPADVGNPNLVKVVLSAEHRAMYFSRAAIPFNRDPGDERSPRYYRHVGVYAYRHDTLIRLAGWKPTPCEQAEKLEQLRALEHDVAIGVVVVDRSAHGIDTPQQYAEFVKRYERTQ